MPPLIGLTKLFSHVLLCPDMSYIIFLLCLMPDEFTYQRESFVPNNRLTINFQCILLALGNEAPSQCTKNLSFGGYYHLRSSLQPVVLKHTFGVSKRTLCRFKTYALPRPMSYFGNETDTFWVFERHVKI